MPRLIALIGPAGCGKTTIAKHLEQTGTYVHLKFADGLKNMLRSIGLNERELEGDLKETPSETLMGETPRHAMQTLGTEWGRNLINENLWAHIFKLRATNALTGTPRYNVVVDDLRFLNEAEVIKELNGTIIRILRPELDTGSDTYQHQSETETKLIKHDWMLLNTGTIGQFIDTIDDILKEKKEK